MDDYQNYIQSGSDNQNTGGSGWDSGCLTTLLSLLVIPVMLIIFAWVASWFK